MPAKRPRASTSAAATAAFASAGNLTVASGCRRRLRPAACAALLAVTPAWALAQDVTPPTQPGPLGVSWVTASGYVLSWPAASDNVAVTGYEYSLNAGTSWLATTARAVQINGRTAGATDGVRVRARDAAGNRSAALSASVTLLATPDTTAPTLTGAITVSWLTGTGYTLSWPEAADNVAVQYYEYSLDGGTTWSVTSGRAAVITGRTPGSTDQVRVRARDASLNRSTPLAAAVTLLPTADTTAPTLTGAITVTWLSGNGYTLNWPAGSDNLAVQYYEYSLDGGSTWMLTSGRAAIITGRTPGSTDQVRVRARDASLNRSIPIAAAVTLLPTADTTAPTLTGAITVTWLTGNGYTLSWPAGSDNLGVPYYEYSVDGGSTWLVTSGRAAVITGRTPGSTDQVRVRARDSSLNRSTPIAAAVTLLPTADTTAPTLTGSITASNLTSTSYTVSWPAASDNLAVQYYQYSLDGGVTWVTTSARAVNISGRSAGTSDQVRVRARDASGNLSASLSATVNLLPPADAVPPQLGGVIVVAPLNSTSYTLNWPAATDNVGVTAYEYSINGGASWVSAGLNRSAAVSGRTPGSTDQARVRARDAVGNLSAVLSTAVTLTAGGDTASPALAGSLTVVQNSATSYSFSWPAASDNVGVAYYQVSWDGGASWINTTGLQWYLSGRTTGATDALRVRARDAAGNFSAVLARDYTVVSAQAYLQSQMQPLYTTLPDYNSCNAGVLVSSHIDAALAEVNAIRALHGLAAVTRDTANEAQMMQASLIMARNNTLTHTPANTLPCWTQAGYDGASSSNLAMAWSSSVYGALPPPSQQIIGYLTDINNVTANNVGHRRWLLNPFLRQAAFGRVIGSDGASGRREAGALKVIYSDFNRTTGEPDVTTKGYVAYPDGNYPARYYPSGALFSFSLVPNKRSLWGNASSNVNFASATISIVDTATNVALPVSNIGRDNVGMGLPNNLQWSATPQTNVNYQVTIGNVFINGSATPSSYSYPFRIVPEATPMGAMKATQSTNLRSEGGTPSSGFIVH